MQEQSSFCINKHSNSAANCKFTVILQANKSKIFSIDQPFPLRYPQKDKKQIIFLVNMV